MSPNTLTGFQPRIDASAALNALASVRSVRVPGGTEAPVVADASTQVSLARGRSASAAYRDPRTTAGPSYLWASPASSSDTVSAIMARNQAAPASSRIYSLSDSWRGLGGALLSQFARSGEDYSQAMVMDRSFLLSGDAEDLPPEEEARRSAQILAMQSSDLATVGASAARATLKVQTRSGQSLELTISVSSGAQGPRGMKVELQSSGQLSADERKAVEQLSKGLDRALVGLGSADDVTVDVAGLLGYDRSVIAGLDLTFTNELTHQKLNSFALHAGDDKQSVELSGFGGRFALSVDQSTRPADVTADQRAAAIRGVLDRIERAADRAHANQQRVHQLMSVFEAMQGATPSDDTVPAGAAAADSWKSVARSAVVAGLASSVGPSTAFSAQVRPGPTAAVSGLADFDASFGGENMRLNRFGSANEVSDSDYRLSQHTAGGRGHGAQTVTERLTATIRAANGPDGMLDVSTGNYSTTTIDDSRTVTTQVAAARDGEMRAVRETQERLLETLLDLRDHAVTRRGSWPSERSSTEVLQ